VKRTFVACLIVLLMAVGLVAAIETDPGYVLMTYGHYTLETSVWMALAVILVLVLVSYFFLVIVRNFLRQGGSFKRWLLGRGHRRSQHQTTAGLIAFTEGNWSRSKRLLVKGASQSETPLMNYLVAARASNALGDDKKTKELLRLAEQSTDGSEVAVGLTQAELQIHNGSLEQALATLTRIRRNADKHPHILNLLKFVYLGLSDWDSLLELLPQLKKHQRVDDEELESLQQQACEALLLNAGMLNKGRQELLNVWRELPKSAKSNNALVRVYVEQLIKAGADDEAERVIVQQLKRDWHDSLVDLFGQVQGVDSSKQLLQAESWLKARNNNARLMLCLGRLSLRNQLWGKAREYFEGSLRLESDPEACAELGRLLASLGEHEKSNQFFQQGLLASTSGLKELPMPKV
jgi:HemY protein